MSNETTTKTPAISADVALHSMHMGGVLTITSSDGERIELDSTQLAPQIINAALLHGLKQKLIDAAAISRNPDTGRSATTADKMAAIREVYERLMAGEWNKRREGGAGATGGLLFAALVRLYAGRKADAEIKVYLDGLTDREQAALRATSRVAPIIAAIKAERDARKADAIDGDAILAGLDE